MNVLCKPNNYSILAPDSELVQKTDLVPCVRINA